MNALSVRFSLTHINFSIPLSHPVTSYLSNPLAALAYHHHHHHHHHQFICSIQYITCHPRSTSNPLNLENHRSLISIRITSPVESILRGSFRQPCLHLSIPDSSLRHNVIIISAHLHPHHFHHLLFFVPGSKHSFFINLFLHRQPAPSGLL